MKQPLCIYHANCADGFTSAWVVDRYFKELDGVELFPGVYQDPPPNVADRDVVMVDFSYKRPVIEEMMKQCRSMLILDHHKSAMEDLKDLNLELILQPNELPRYRAVFDTTRSGARVTWDYFFQDTAPPQLLLYIEDRDLWKFDLPRSRAVNAAVFSYDYDLLTWDLLMSVPISGLAKDGEAIERKHHKDVRELIKVVTRFVTIDGHRVPAANLPYTYTSDAGHLLSIGDGTDEVPDHPFAVCYWDTPDGRVFSLRSGSGGADVQKIAVKYGGGGHKHAAGFRLPYDAMPRGWIFGE